MTAYAMVELTVHDPQRMGEYAEKVGDTVTAHGGRYIIRGKPAEVLEGTAGQHGFKVVLEFPSVDAARGWYNSPEYQAIIDSRLQASEANFLLIEGL